MRNEGRVADYWHGALASCLEAVVKIAGLGVIIIVAIIMLVDTIHKTPEEARKQAIDSYVWASADYRDRFRDLCLQ
jgi:hypothetical protein